MMDYFLQTNSIRIVDVLIKVQSPHEKHLFDRLAEWLRGSQKNQALTLFGHIVRKHPTWLHKVVHYSLMKEILKLLKTEKEIIPLMSALLCIIVLLPIIPSLMSSFFQDLFEAFSHLASWNCMNPSKLSHDLLVHLQIGLYTLFHRLYGMYPCNFIAFLRLEYVNKENAAVFTHTIKPLLESVKMHPLLVSSNEKAEVNAIRWKKKEPHDVVVECARFSLDNVEKHQENNADCNCHMKPFDFSPSIMETVQSPVLSSLHKEKLMDYSRYGNIWSPSDVVLATPPPINNSVPHTPTPNIPSYSKTPITSGGHTAGSSPPETAIEATPETTPMKDHSLKQNVRPFPASNACRSMWKEQNLSQPSSPLKKETSPFGFPEPIKKSDSPSIVTSQKLLRLVNDRNQSFHQNSTPSSPNPINEHSPEILQSRKNQMNFDSPLIPVNTSLDSNHDELESTTEQNNSGIHENEDFETEGSPCCDGGLHIPDQRSILDFARRRFRMYSHCVAETNYYSSAGTSPADQNTGSLMKISATAKLKRSNSWPELKRFKSSLVQIETRKIVNSKEFQVKKFEPLKEICSSSTQTIQQWPEFYEHMFLGIFSEENRSKAAEQIDELPNRIPQLSDDILDSYIALSIKKRPLGNQRQSEESLRDQIQLLVLQLQYERHRREIHAERNRRLLGKSRSNRSIESHNSTLRDQVNRLSTEILTLNTDLNSLRKKMNSKEQEYFIESNSWKIKYQNEIEENKMLRSNIETLKIRLTEESKAKKLINTEVQNVSGELFDLKNDMQQALYQANLGQQYREELTNLQKEMILLGEIQIKCREKLAELNSLKARDAELDYLQQSYKEEIIGLFNFFFAKLYF